MASNSNRYRMIMLLWLCVTAAFNVSISAADTISTKCPEVWIRAERLPDMNVPRAGHCTFYVNGELTVVGGHTSGFMPTPTAEYYKDGAWHLMTTVYEHDNGFAVQLSSGKVLIAGGHEKSLGIGQTYVAEMYDPEQHQFDGFGCLDKARSLANGVELDSCHVIIAGNHYSGDAIECFDGKKSFSFLKEVCTGRSSPNLLRISADDAIIFGSTDTKLHSFIGSWVDRVKGEPFHVPLLETWSPFPCFSSSEISFIGDAETGDYSYLIPAKNDEGQIGILKVSGTEFSLLPTVCPIPMESQWGSIEYYSLIIANRLDHKAYLLGCDITQRQYLLCIDYGKEKTEDAVPLTLYYTDPLEEIGYTQPVLTSEGNIILAGGITDSNFFPFKSVYLFYTGQKTAQATVEQPFWTHYSPWIAGLLLIAMLTAILLYKHYKNSQQPAISQDVLSDTSNEELMQRICQVMEEKKLYLNSELKISDLASLLKISPRIISECIKTGKGCSFVQFVNSYRIEYAKQLLKEPGVKIVSVYLESGFSNETSFFRTFKSFTGMTPKEWVSRL